MKASYTVQPIDRRALLPMLLFGVLLSASLAFGFGDERVVVKKVDRLGNETYESMTRGEARDLESSYRAESFYSMSALLKAQRAWKEDTSNEGMFPRSAAKTKQVRILKSYRDPAEAESAVQKYEQREVESAARRDKYLREKCTRVVRSGGGNNRGNNRGKSQTKKVFDQAKYNEAVAKDKARKAELEKACQLYESMLEQCRQEAGVKQTTSEKWW